MAAQLQEYRQSTTEKIVASIARWKRRSLRFRTRFFVLDKEGRIELKNPAAAGLASSLHLEGQLPDRLQAIARNILASGENFLPNSFNEAITYRINDVTSFFLPRVLAMRNKEDALFGWRWFCTMSPASACWMPPKTDLVATVSHEIKVR